MVRNKRGQTEMLGLAVVVILIAVGMLLFIRFSLLDPKEDIKKTFVATETAYNVIGGALDTSTTECKPNTDLTYLLANCAVFGDLICTDGRNSCEYAEYVLDVILNETLIAWGNMSFKLDVFPTGGDNIINFSNGGCTDSSIGEKKRSPIPLNPGVLNVEMKIC
jgi:hypothetical protein